MKRFLRLILPFFLFLNISCVAFPQNSIPYAMSGEFVMEDGCQDYSICGVDVFLLNKSNKEIENISIVFFLFDKDGEPAYECRNKISAKIEQYIAPEESASFCISLDRFMNAIPSEPLLVDYLYLAKIEYEDGSVWEDPYGLAAFK